MSIDISQGINLDHAYFAGYKPIRNALRKYDPKSILLGSLDYLYRPAKDPIEQLRKHPWTVLLVVKWCFIDEGSSIPGRPPIPQAKLMQLLQKAHELSDRSRMPSEYEHVSLFLRAISFQQFLYQGRPTLDGLARQEILFARVEPNHFFRVKFLAATGVCISDFLRLSFCIVARFLDTESHYSINERWFSTVHGAFPQKTIAAFLEALSVPVEQLGRKLREGDTVKRRAAEYGEQTPFLAFPLIRMDGTYVSVYRSVLVRSVDHFIYDLLKRLDLTTFNKAFGSRFERYVGRVLEGMGLPLVDEDGLKRMLPGLGKLVDFVIADGDKNVFIDAKAVEMSARGKVAHLRDVVFGATKTSLIKAVEQAHEVNNRLPDKQSSGNSLSRTSTSYLLVVTYKDLYISSGRVLTDSIGADALESLIASYSSNVRIPAENMYFLTIDELELLVELVRSNATGLTEMFERAKSQDANPATRKFIFSQHLAELEPPTARPPELEEAKERLIRDVELALGA